MLRKLIFLGVVSLVLAPGAALSLGLGDIRLNSYLNQPMDAEIALSVASPGELDSLRVALAPAAAFSQRGLDRPAYFDELRFRVQGTGPTSAVIRVSSTSPIVEPFLTFLIEARWSGGQMLREYTVLLDPPVFMPAPAQAPAPERQPAVDAPRPAPAPVSRPATPPPATATPAFEQGPEYSVRRNDTLWAIAQQLRPDTALSTNQVMVALFRENPHAFDGNINRLRAGTILRVPSRQQMAATTSGEATAEVRRQTESWRAAAPAPVDRRLELAPPAETARAPAPESAPVREPAAPAPELLDAVQELRSELAETRRLMEVKDAEIAALQERLAELESAPAPAEPADAPVAVAPEPVAPEPEAVPETAAPPSPPAPAPTLLDRVFAVLGSLWLWLVLAIVLIAAAVGVFLNKRKDQERSIEQDLAETGTWGTLEDTDGRLAAATAGAPAAAGKFEPRSARGENLDAILVEEADKPAPREKPQAPVARVTPPAAQPAAESGAEEEYQYPFEDTIAGETGINLDQSDPMAEADFHMAYGLYDQAAEIIKKAVDREPDRYDLRRKLVDICFVWGNADEFLAQAQAIRGLKDGNAADWAKIAIMGRQLCPSEPMFLATETPDVDVDVGDEESATPEGGEGAAPAGEWLDFDVGESDESLQALGDTREQPAPGMESASPEHTAELNLEELGMDLDLGESGEHALQDLAERAPEFFEEPEEEPPHEPKLRLSEPSAEAAEEAPAEEAPAEEAPGESDDVSGTQMMEASKIRSGEAPTQRGEGWELAEDEPTLSGSEGFEEEGEDRASETLIFEGGSDGDAATMTDIGGFDQDDEEESDHTLIKKFEPSQEAPTVEVGGFEDDDDADLGLDALTEALKADLDQPEEEAGAGSTQRKPALEPEQVSEHELGDTAEMAASEMDEIGTKLDLARAYIDMGDPEGARSILGEVLEEGDEAQREDARQLLASLD